MQRIALPAIAVLAVLVLFAGETRAPAVAETPDLVAPAAPGEFLVRLTPDAIDLPDSELASQLGGRVLARLPEIRGVRLGVSETPAAAVERLAANPLVEFAEPNHVVHSLAAPNDALYSSQSSYLALIEAPLAWEIERGSESVRVAVLDTGVDLDHEDLAGKVWQNQIETPADGIDDDGNGCPDDLNGCSFMTANSDPSCATVAGQVDDDSGHGTFVAGVIAARADNGVGSVGAAPDVTILPVKILDCTGAGTAGSAAEGILYAARSGARVANISFAADGESVTLARAIHEAVTNYGMVVVAASGNDGTEGVSFPARLPDTIAVASAGSLDDPLGRSPFSDWGAEVSLAAPGADILSTVPLELCGHGWSCLDDGPYARASGTSFAAPLVSALAALIVSRYPNSSPEAVRQIMVETAADLPDGDTPHWDGAGLIQMEVALSVRRFSLGLPGTTRE